MKVIYTKKPIRTLGVVFRDPDMFFGVITKATEVIIEGDYPNIVEAYEAAGIKVSTQAKKDNGTTNPQDMKVEQLKETLTAKGIEFPDNAKKTDLVKLLEQAGGA